MSVLTPCPERISSETLSALTDDGLEAAKAARLSAHAATCLACQTTLAAYGAVERLLREQPIPAAAPVDMAAIRARRATPFSWLSSGREQTGASRPRIARRPRISRALWGGIGAAVAAALLIAAFSQVFARLGRVTPTTTVTPARTATPTAHLDWSERTIPLGLMLVNASLSLAFSPANTQDGWICQEGPAGSYAILATTDQARSWRMTGKFSQKLTTQSPNDCYLTPDKLDPSVLALTFDYGCGQCGTFGEGTYISGDGGATWRPLDGGALGVDALVTLNGHTFALIRQSEAQGAIAQSTLLVSSDGLATWSATGPGGPNGDGSALLPDPTNGALLLSDGVNILWRSDNGGASWTQITLSVAGVSASGYTITAASSAPSGGWRICAAQQGGSPPPPIQCSTDLGRTWVAAPALSETVACTNCGKPGSQQLITITEPCPVWGMTPEGALLSYCQPTGTIVTQKATFNNPTWNICILEPGAQTWRSLGAQPTSVANPFATPLPGTPIVYPTQDISAEYLGGAQSASGAVVWYSDPLKGILVVAALP